MTTSPLPIVLLHHNQPKLLLRCVRSIVEFTKHPYKLFVVDNASPESAETEQSLNAVAQNYLGTVIRNTRNEWALGFNRALQHPDWPHDADFYLFSDADIVVPPASASGLCWLSRMREQMDTHACIGKLGLSLALDNLRSNPELAVSCVREERYLIGPKIGSNVIAPVDTTMALYRKDLFIAGFKFRVGHASLVKPHYYTCRTSQDLACQHLGWDYYPGGNDWSADVKKAQWSKAWCMARHAAYLDPALLNLFPTGTQYLLRARSFAARLYFGCKVAALIFLHLASRFPRSINEIQASLR